MDHSSPSPSSCSESNSAAMPSPGASNYSERTRDVLKSVVRSRKSWKSCRDGEVVWPLELEAALLEGLENYVPEDTRETRILGRFPMRNRFLSNYIYQKTGKRRTAKQVGSRIQQLRDSGAGKRLLELLHPYPPQQSTSRHSLSPSSGRKSSPKPLPLWRDTSSYGSASPDGSPTTPSQVGTSHQSQFRDENGCNPNSVNVVYIDLLPTDSSTPTETYPSGKWCSELPYGLISHVEHVNHIQISQQPRHLHHIDPTVTLISLSDISAYSAFTVRENRVTVFNEKVPLTPAGSLFGGTDAANSPQLYRTALVPGYWERISCSADPTKFTIEQRVFHDRPSTAAPILFSAIYRFRFIQHSQFTPYTHIDYVQNLETTNIPAATTDVFPNAVFDVDTLNPFMSSENDDLLAEIDSLNVQGSGWDANSPSTQSCSSLLSASASATSSRHNSASPAGSCMSETLPSCTSHMPSTMLYPAGAVPSSSLMLGQHMGHIVQPPKSELYLGSDYPQDLFDNTSILVGHAYGIQSQ